MASKFFASDWTDTKKFPTDPLPIAIWTLHDCPSQMNENSMISNSKLTSDNELIW